MTQHEIATIHSRIDQLEGRIGQTLQDNFKSVFDKIDDMRASELHCRTEVLQRLTKLETVGWIRANIGKIVLSAIVGGVVTQLGRMLFGI